MKRRAGDVHPSEYNWKEQFDLGAVGYLAMDVGKVRGLAQYAAELEAELGRLQEALTMLAEGSTPWMDSVGDAKEPWQVMAEYARQVLAVRSG